MARIRSIKPAFFQHEAIYEAEKACGLPLRLAYVGLWTQADRRGLFRWRPRELKLNILPWDAIDFAAVLDALAKHHFVLRYEVNSHSYGAIPSFGKHQIFNLKERPAAEIPDCPQALLDACRHGADTVPALLGLGIGRESEGREGEGWGGGAAKSETNGKVGDNGAAWAERQIARRVWMEAHHGATAADYDAHVRANPDHAQAMADGDGKG